MLHPNNTSKTCLFITPLKTSDLAKFCCIGNNIHCKDFYPIITKKGKKLQINCMKIPLLPLFLMLKTHFEHLDTTLEHLESEPESGTSKVLRGEDQELSFDDQV